MDKQNSHWYKRISIEKSNNSKVISLRCPCVDLLYYESSKSAECGDHKAWHSF